MSWTPDSSENDLLQALDRGDRTVFDQLFERHRAQLHWLVSLRLDPRLSRRMDASDVIQETHLEALNRLEDFIDRRPMPFDLWLRKTAVQKLAQLRRLHLQTERRDVRRELPNGSSMALVSSLIDDRNSPSRDAARSEQCQLVMRVVAQLSEDDQDVLLMKNVEGLSHQEIGYLLDVEPATVRKRYGRALVRLRQLLVRNGLTGTNG